MDQKYKELEAMTMQWEVHLHMVDSKKAALWSQQEEQQEIQFHAMRAGDDETCMQVQTCMIQSSHNTGKIFLPGEELF